MSGSFEGSFSGSFTGSITSASFAQTASFTPNALVTASVSSNNLTFTKGDGSTFNLTVDTGSGGGGSTFPFTGSAIITGSLGVTGSISSKGNTFLSITGSTGATYSSLYTEAVGANNAFIAARDVKMSGSNNTTIFQEIFNSNLIAATNGSSMTIDDAGIVGLTQYSAIIGGGNQTIRNIGAGGLASNTIQNSIILGGADNTIESITGGVGAATPKDNIIIGGELNTISHNTNSGRRNAIISSYSSSITNVTDSVIIGAQSSSITHDDVIILGGSGVTSIKADTIYTTNMVVSADKVFTLTPTSPLPTTGVLTGSFAVSSSSPPKPYFWDGSAWNALF